MTRVLYDGRLLVRPPSGVGDVASGIHEGLVALAGDGRIGLEVAVDRAGPGLDATVLAGRGFMHWQLPREARRTGADLVLVPRQTRPVLSPVPVRPVIHDVGFLRMPQEYGDTRLISLSTRYALRRSTVAVVSQFTLDEMRAQGLEGRAVVLPIQAVHRIDRRDHAGAPYLLTVGVQNRHKNLARLVRAWDRADTGGVELRICARPGNDSAEFERALAQSPKRASIHVLQGLGHDEYLALLGGAHAYVQPSLYEGLGIPLLDVAAAGIPVVGSRLGNTGAVLRPSPLDLAFDPFDVAATAAAIERVLHDAGFRAAASDWLTSHIAMTDWKAVAAAALG